MRTSLSILLCILLMTTPFYAEELENTEVETPLNIGNKNCPVSGKPVNGLDSYIHQGKEYNLCSKGCKIPLSQDPEKFIGDEP